MFLSPNVELANDTHQPDRVAYSLLGRVYHGKTNQRGHYQVWLAWA